MNYVINSHVLCFTLPLCATLRVYLYVCTVCDLNPLDIKLSCPSHFRSAVQLTQVKQAV